jgi:hypothetical protein
MGESTQEEIRAIKSYLLQLTGQLQYLMLNLDEENLSEELVSELEQAAQAAKTVEGVAQTFAAQNGRLLSRIEDADGAVSELEQLLTGFRLAVNAMKAEFNENGLKITNGGFRICDENGEATFTADEDGAVVCTNLKIRLRTYNSDAPIYIGSADEGYSETRMELGPNRLVMATGGRGSTNEEGAFGLYVETAAADSAGSSLKGSVLRLNDGAVELGGDDAVGDGSSPCKGRVKCERLMVNGNYYTEGTINGVACLVRA